MNWRKSTYLSYAALRGYRFPSFLKQYSKEYERGAGYETAKRALAELLRHCRQSVPYYAAQLRRLGDPPLEEADPVACLARLPILTKEIIRDNFARLQTADLGRRQCSYNTSGGSTGEPVRLVQDRGYEDRCKAVSLFCHALWGREAGQPVIRLWGSERDIKTGTQSARARFFNWLTNSNWLNAFDLSPQRMRECVDTLNRKGLGLIMGYASAAYELARFVEREKLSLRPQQAVVTNVGTLYSFMREPIARVFGCPVYNLYGSSEVSLIGCEIPGVNGLWVPPWSNFVEILDDKGIPVQPGEEGNIVVTCLTNFAMPLVRYQIGDRGALMPDVPVNGHAPAQRLKHVSDRNADLFRTRDQKVVDGGYFTHLLHFRPWVGKFQVVQKASEHVVFRIVQVNGGPTQAELDNITAQSRQAMGDDCRIDFEFPNALPTHPAGKHRCAISEVAA